MSAFFLRKRWKVTLVLVLVTVALLVLVMMPQRATQPPARYGGGRHSFWKLGISPEHRPVTPRPLSDRKQPNPEGIQPSGAQIQDILVKANLEQRQPTAAKSIIPSKESLSSSLVPVSEDLRNIKSAQYESHHVFFLKVHKVGGTTVTNVLFRFAAKRRLSVMLPRLGHSFSQNSADWAMQIMPPPLGATHFDILCNHLIFNETTIRSVLPEDTKFIAIVREPFHQFVSAFFYYSFKYPTEALQSIPGDDPLTTYLENPKKYESGPIGGSFTHNRMSFDFGMSQAVMENETSVMEYIAYLNKTFDLVMISERFDESMVLMKRLLGWQLRDVLYIKNNVFNKKPRNFTEEQKRSHRNFNLADYKLYDHFERLFQTKVRNEGPSFQKEVAAFVRLRERVEQFCQGKEAGTGTLVVAETEWSSEFRMNRANCRLMDADDKIWYVDRMKSRQYNGTSIAGK